MRLVFLSIILNVLYLSTYSQWTRISTLSGIPFEFSSFDSSNAYLTTTIGGVYSTRTGWKTVSSCKPDFHVWDLKLVDTVLVGLGNRRTDYKPGVFTSTGKCNWVTELVPATGGMQTINLYKDHFYYNIGGGGLLAKHNIWTNHIDSVVVQSNMFYREITTLVDHQFVIGRSGYDSNQVYHIYKMNNDGTWKEVYNGKFPIRVIRSINQFIYVNGPDGTLMYSTDTGENWKSMNNPAFGKLNILNAWFTSPDTGYICGGNPQDQTKGFLYRTYNAGTTWENINPANGVMINDIYFINDSTGICADNDGNIYKTYNRGGEARKDTIQDPKDTTTIGDTNELTIFQSNQNLQINIYPNPTKDWFTVEFISKTDELKVVTLKDVTGKTVLKKRTNANSAIIDLTSYAKGMYFIQMNGEDWNAVKKVVKE